MPIVIRAHVLMKEFEKALPKRFRTCRRPKLSNNNCVTLVIFPETVVQSRALNHALEKILPTTEPIVMYAEDFTQESFEIMREKGVFFDSLHDWDWTDASHIHIKIVSGSAVKQRLITKRERSRKPH